MKKLTFAFMATMMLMTISACRRDIYGDLFIKREPVTFRVQSEEGQPLSNVSLKTEELEGFGMDGDVILNGIHYAYTDTEGMVTVKAAVSNSPGPLTERTTRFTFIATDYVVFDTVFNSWEGTIDIVLYKE